MRRATDPRLSMVLAFLAGAVVLLHGVLAGGAAMVRRYGFGLAEPWEEGKVKDPLILEELRRLAEDERPVVEIDPPEDPRQKAAKDAKFRAEWNSKVARQTQARVKALAPVVVASLDRRPPAEAVEPAPAPQPAPRPGVELQPAPGTSPLAMRVQPTPPSPAKEPGASPRPSPWKKKLSLRNLTPSNGSLEKVIPAAFPDYLKDIDYGDRTLLNTKEFKFASFFNRVKRAVAQHWHPDREYTRRDPEGNVYGFKTRMTVLHILLNPDGSLRKIVLERPCGLGFLDDEAIRAFKKAAPFPNPPRRLVSPTTGVIAFRFGFIFELTRSPSWRILRLK